MPRKRLQRRFGLPEALLVGLITVLVLLAAAWLWANFGQTWNRAAGKIVSAALEETHINSQDYVPKVEVQYEYTVDGVQYIDEYTGVWPQAGSPNALLRSQLRQSMTAGHPVTVFYDPRDPGRSSLHGKDEAQLQLILWSFVAVLLAAGYYVFAVYPRWRGGRRYPY